jgi:hypothetical protein
MPVVPPPTPATNTPGTAVIEVTAFSVQEFAEPYGYQYGVQLGLKEVSGASGVTMSNMLVSFPGGTSDMDCAPPTVHIPAGHTWNLASLGYCAPYAWGARASRVTFAATLTDDVGTTGSLVITADVTK